MMKFQIDMQHCQPIPIAKIIQTANSFNCDIYMDFESKNLVDVKSYDALKNGWTMQVRQPVMYFRGHDELAAQNTMLRLFVGHSAWERNYMSCHLS